MSKSKYRVFVLSEKESFSSDEAICGSNSLERAFHLARNHARFILPHLHVEVVNIETGEAYKIQRVEYGGYRE